MKIKNQKDFFSGLMFAILGTGFSVGAWKNYHIGTSAQMGAGYFPWLLGIILAIIGIAITIKSIINHQPNPEKIGKWAWRPVFFILSANILFGIMIGGLPSIGLPPMGLIIGIFVLTFMASFASSEFKFIDVFALASILALGSYLTFIVALKLQVPVWPSFT